MIMTTTIGNAPVLPTKWLSILFLIAGVSGDDSCSAGIDLLHWGNHSFCYFLILVAGISGNNKGNANIGTTPRRLKLWFLSLLVASISGERHRPTTMGRPQLLNYYSFGASINGNNNCTGIGTTMGRLWL